MKKIFVIAVLVSFAAGSVALAAVSSPCGARKAVPPRAPRVVEDQGFRRDVLGQKVPVQTVEKGDAMTDTATKYNETLITGKD